MFYLTFQIACLENVNNRKCKRQTKRRFYFDKEKQVCREFLYGKLVDLLNYLTRTYIFPC